MALKRINTKGNDNMESGNGGEKKTYSRLGEGEYEGRLVYVADLGLQENTYDEDKPPCQQICLGIEIVGASNDDGTPRLMFTKPFNIFSRMNEKGNEFKYFSYFNPNAKPDTVADWDSVLGEPCSVVVESVQGKGKNAGNVYDNLSKINPMPAKYKKDVEQNRIAPCIGDCDDPDNEATKALYGLAKYIFDKRVDPSTVVKKAPAAKKQSIEAPF